MELYLQLVGIVSTAIWLLGIMDAQLRDLLKPFEQNGQYCIDGFKGALK